MIEVEHLTKRYGDIEAVRDVSFSVKKGEILGFLGPNGAGKTTTLRILTCFMAPTEGKARVAGFDVIEESLEVRRRIGYLPEQVPLYREMTPRQLLHFLGRLHGMNKPDRIERVEKVAAQAAIDDVLDRTIGKLSKGYRQRVGIATALIHDPEVLVLDEPTVGLDPRQIAETRSLIKGLAGEHTVMLSTHILPEVSMTCQRVAIIHRGRIIAEDTPDRLVSSMTTTERTFVRVRKGDAVEAKVRAVPGVTSVRPDKTAGGDGRVLVVESKPGADARPKIAKAVIESGTDLLELRPLSMSLEDIFVELTTEEEGVEE